MCKIFPGECAFATRRRPREEGGFAALIRAHGCAHDLGQSHEHAAAVTASFLTLHINLHAMMQEGAKTFSQFGTSHGRPCMARGLLAIDHRGRTMGEPDDEALRDFMRSGATLLGLPLDAAWEPSITGHLRVTLRHAAVVDAFELPDEAEPAPVFRA